MNPISDLERLAAVRPVSSHDTQELVGPAERDLLLRTILTSEPADALADAAVRGAQRAGPTRHRRKYAVGVAVTTAAAAAIAGSLTLTGGQHPTVVGKHPAAAGKHATVGKPHVQTAAYVVQRFSAAVASETSGSLLSTTTSSDGVTYRYLYDLASGAERFTSSSVSGAVQIDESSTGTSATSTSTVVDYSDKSWWTLKNDPSDSPTGGIDPASVRQLLAAGDLVVVGDDTINGQAAIHLQYPSRLFTLNGKTFATDTSDLWVDTTTYLPIRETGYQRFGDNKSAGLSKRRPDSWQSDFQWSATPPSNITVPIPAGFTHLAVPPTQVPPPGGGLG
jgi:hypothetical protein